MEGNTIPNISLMAKTSLRNITQFTSDPLRAYELLTNSIITKSKQSRVQAHITHLRSLRLKGIQHPRAWHIANKIANGIQPLNLGNGKENLVKHEVFNIITVWENAEVEILKTSITETLKAASDVNKLFETLNTVNNSNVTTDDIMSLYTTIRNSELLHLLRTSLLICR